MDIRHLRTAIDGHQSYHLVALLDGQLIGTLHVNALQTDSPFLSGIYVHPDHRQ